MSRVMIAVLWFASDNVCLFGVADLCLAGDDLWGQELGSGK